MSASTFYMKQGDTGNPIRAALRTADGAIDLTGATVRFTMRLQGASTLTINRATATVDSPATAGEVRYQIPVDVAHGVYEYEWEITFSDSTILTVPTTGYDWVEIADDLA